MKRKIAIGVLIFVVFGLIYNQDRNSRQYAKEIKRLDNEIHIYQDSIAIANNKVLDIQEEIEQQKAVLKEEHAKRMFYQTTINKINKQLYENSKTHVTDNYSDADAYNWFIEYLESSKSYSQSANFPNP